MDKLVERFRKDPIFAATVVIVGAIVATNLLNAATRTIVAGGYAYNAPKTNPTIK